MAKKRQSRMAERKGVLEKLDGDSDKGTGKVETVSKRSKDSGASDGEFVELSSLNKGDEYIDLGKLKDKKDSESKKTFDKLKNIGTSKGKLGKAETAATTTSEASTEANDVAKKISEISGTPHEDIKPKIVGDKKISNSDAMKLFGQLGKDTIMSKAFTEVLSKLLKSGKITNENVSNILFEYLDKGLLSKSDVAKISSELKII